MPKYQHDNFGDAVNHIFAKGIITAVDSTNDLADVTVEGYQNGTDVPLYYHCEPDSELRSNGAIYGAASAFAVDDEVIVMCDSDGAPVRVVGFVDGIKQCLSCYLLLCAIANNGTWYTVWDVANECVASIEWDDEPILFPRKADLTGLTPDDVLYLWLMSRPWDESVPEESRVGLPEVTLYNAAEVYTCDSEEPQPDLLPPVECLANCSLPPGVNEISDSTGCSGSGEIDGRSEFGELGYQNTVSANRTSSCSGSRGSGEGVHWWEDEIQSITATSRAYGALNQPNKNDEDISAGVWVTGPFVSALLREIGNPESILYVVRQWSQFTNTEDAYEYCYRVKTYLPDFSYVLSGSGAKYESNSRSGSVSFDTPLGSLASIPLSMESTREWDGMTPTNNACSFSDITYYGIGELAEWGGEPGLIYPKNPVLVKRTPRVMFQTYYYSAPILSYTLNVPPEDMELYPGGEEYYSAAYSEVYEDIIAAVEFFPDRDAMDTSPMTMSENESFTSAIEDLFAAAKATPSGPLEDPSVRHFNVTVYN